MSAVYGMDLEAVESLARDMEQAAQRLGNTRAELDWLATTSGWLGADAAGFLQSWGAHRAMLGGVVDGLSAQGNLLRSQVQEQRSASAAGGGGATSVSRFRDDAGDTGSVLGWLSSRVNGAFDDISASAADVFGSVLQGAGQWQQDRIADMVDWTSDLAEGLGSVADGVFDRVEATLPALGRLSEQQTHLLRQFLGIFTGDPPQVAELGASVVLLGGLAVGVMVNGVTGVDAHVFDDGTPWVGASTLLTETAPELTTIAGASSLAAHAMQTYEDDGVRIDVVSKPGEPDAYVVSIPGTEPPLTDPAGWKGNLNGRDWPANAYLIAYGESSGSQAVAMAMEEFGIPAGAKVLLQGHSQGGIIAASLAADPAIQARYNVAGVMAWGSPGETMEVPDNTPVLSLEHGFDITPWGDLFGMGQGGPEDLTKVKLPAQLDENWLPMPGVNHATERYESSMNNLDRSDAMALQQFESDIGAEDFYTSDPTQVQSYNVEFGRDVT